MSVVDGLRKLEAAATPGPWEDGAGAAYDQFVQETPGYFVDLSPVGMLHGPNESVWNDLHLITASRNSLLALLACADALVAIRRRIPYDAENEDANGWGRVDDAIALLETIDG